MTTFNTGDRVVTKITGMAGTVATTAFIVGVRFDNGEIALMDVGALEVPPPLPRSFSVGQHVRIMGFEGGIGIVIEDDGDAEDSLPYTVKETETGFSNIYDASDLEPWTPQEGDRVAIHDEPDKPGTVLAVDDDCCIVKWDEFEHPQNDWDFGSLVPFESKSKFTQGDKVVYVRGVLTKGSVADVVRDEANGAVAVVWDTTHWKYAGQLHGIYPADCFDHYHESAFSIAA